MTATADKINAPVTQAAWTKPRNWAKPVVDASIKPFAQGKVDRSLVPVNRVALTWRDAIDIVNPLHQIPLVGDIYRSATGEKISGLARVLGGFLYGGLSGGFVASLTAAYAQAHEDQSPGERVVAMLFGDEPATAPSAPEPAKIQLASADLPLPVTQALLARDGAAQQAVTGLNIPSVSSPAKTQTEPPVFLAGLPVDHNVPPDNMPGGTAGNGTDFPSLAGKAVGSAQPAAENPAQNQPGAQPPSRPGSIQLADAVPLRERLNRKQATSISTLVKPLDQIALPRRTPLEHAAPGQERFIAHLPKDAALLAAAQNRNLELLQGFTAGQESAPVPAEGDNGAETSTIAAASAGGSRHNPLPLQLVQDMMLQALDKYQSMKAGAPAAAGFGVQ